MARIKVIQPGQADGRLKEVYNDIIAARGKIAEVHKIQSLRPESIVSHMDMYLEIMYSKSELSRAEREMMAVIVSVSNGCEYCRLHHSEALNHYWKDDERISCLTKNLNSARLNNREISLCRFADLLTRDPARYNEDSELYKLRKSGLSDKAILDATLVVSYFNFVNRIVLALGVESNQEEISGYNF